MQKSIPLIRALLLSAALPLAIPAMAGNIPQYRVSSEGAPYAEFADGTPIRSVWGEGTTVLFPNDYETPNAYSAEGFPIGFDFRFGGRLVNQFVLSTAGDIYLGKDIVNFGGDAFRISMSPIKNGISKADAITYKTEGEAGQRVLTIQYKRAVLNETSSSKGKYSLQFRLYEADGRVELAFKEIETVYSSGHGFDTGISGWDENDVIQLTAEGLEKPLSISPEKRADLLNPDSYIHWDSEDYEDIHTPVISFIPESDATPPATAPQELSAQQSGNKLLINCRRADGADATVVLVSSTPFTDADLPVDGESFRAAYRDTNGVQQFPTLFGNARALYYGNDEQISLTLDNVADDTPYYIKALSVNGYPAYSRDNSADLILNTTQGAPTDLFAASTASRSVEVTVRADYPVIVAKTTEATPGYQQGYTGLFGTPAADAKVGDTIEGGGEVVYVGEPGSFTMLCDENELNYLRAWTVKEGTLSAKTFDAASFPLASLPFESDIENWPYGEQLRFWSATDNQFIPWRRPYQGDATIYAVTSEDVAVSLSTPQLNIDSPVRLSFSFAMETARDAAETGDSSVAIPQGSDPGSFGDTGFLRVLGNNTPYKTITTYSGTMVSAGDGTNEDGSSTYETVEVDLPALGKGSYITFSFSTPAFTKLFLRDIKIVRTGEAPSAPAAAPLELSADEDRDAVLYVSCRRAPEADNTLVLFSEQPFGESETPEDGRAYSPGSRLGNATVLYYGADELIEAHTDNLTVIPDFDSDCYFRAISANTNPLYNTENVADFTYRTLPDMSYPRNMAAEEKDGGLKVEADRAPHAAGTLLLLTEGEPFSGKLTDGEVYAQGEKVGNATVLYRGEDEHISIQTEALKADRSYTVTGYSYNSRGWYGDVSRTASATTALQSINLDTIDWSTAKIYTPDGLPLHVTTPADLPAGIYLINGQKLRLK